MRAAAASSLHQLQHPFRSLVGTRSSSGKMSTLLTQVSSAKCFGGLQKVFSHESKELGCKMNFAVYVPPKALTGDNRLPVMYWLSGLTCTEQNFITKSGFQRYAAENDLVVVAPDTSPRGLGIPGEDDSWDFGTGAGFYVNATQDPWKKNYRMYSYVTEELPRLIESELPFVSKNKRSISGHSMGGHGALICALKNPGAYAVATAFAPINNPINSPWGQKAFTGYLGPDTETWKEWDATELAKSYNGPPLNLIIDQADNFIESCRSSGLPLVYRKQEGYDHGYYFVSTFIEEHIKHHAKILNQK